MGVWPDMAMTCINGSRECSGCQQCNELPRADVVGHCAQCGEEVYSWEGRYEFPGGEIVHDDCMLDFVRRDFYRAGIE